MVTVRGFRLTARTARIITSAASCAGLLAGLLAACSAGPAAGPVHRRDQVSPLAGVQLWASRFGGPGTGYDYAMAIAVSPGGAKVFVTGQKGRSPGDQCVRGLCHRRL